jgi:hypothetical protein
VVVSVAWLTVLFAFEEEGFFGIELWWLQLLMLVEEEEVDGGKWLLLPFAIVPFECAPSQQYPPSSMIHLPQRYIQGLQTSLRSLMMLGLPQLEPSLFDFLLGDVLWCHQWWTRAPCNRSTKRGNGSLRLRRRWRSGGVRIRGCGLRVPEIKQISDFYLFIWKIGKMEKGVE